MAIGDEKYVSTTTYRKSGAAVQTATWIVALDGGNWTPFSALSARSTG
ncbi:MAG TPA: hypothetical protein VMI73_22020 [Trebonia sp.]|nr:hypothetical protein [Trebonia sp.]